MPGDEIHSDLLLAQQYVYQPLGLSVDSVKKEAESKEYGAATFLLSGRRIIFRVGKITPTKIGQFVTLWKRIGSGPIIPYDTQDQVDFFVIGVRGADGRLGQFVFPKALLLDKGIISHNGKGGKLAIRVYPLWDKAENTQAKKTQAWQLQYFLEFDTYNPIDIAQIKKLF